MLPVLKDEACYSSLREYFLNGTNAVLLQFLDFLTEPIDLFFGSHKI